MNEISERTPIVIATEINSIKDQTRTIILSSSIEIGRRLTEAKSILEHGQWGEWLEKSVDYSHDTASNLMKIYKEYGNSNIESIRNLGYTKAIALLGVPKEEREQFAKDNDLLNITVRKLQEAIKEKEDMQTKLAEADRAAEEACDDCDAAREELRKVLKEHEKSQEEVTKLQSSMSELNKQLSEAQASGNNDEIDRLSNDLEKTDNELTAAHQKIKDLELQLKEPIEITAAPIIERVPEDVERELEELRIKTKELESRANQQSDEPVLKFKVYLDSLVKGFGDLLKALAEIADQEEREKYKNAVNNLIGKMSERL